MNSLIVHSSAWYPPYSVGGTEIYLSGLTGALRDLGVESLVMIPRQSDELSSYEYRGTRVETYPVNTSPTRTEIKSGRPHSSFEEFRDLLRRNRNAIYHQHSWTRGCGPHHLIAARNLGMRTILTVHVPGATCLRGTMVRFGETACDGKIEDTTCGACWLQAHRIPLDIARLIGRLPISLSHLASQSETRISTVFAARALGAKKLSDLKCIVNHADHIVCVCQWLLDVFLLNGVPKSKLSLNRQGLDVNDIKKLAQDRSHKITSKVKFLFLGRWDPVKGIDTVVKAFRSLPSYLPIELSICCPEPATGETSYKDYIRSIANGDDRIKFRGAVSRDELASVLHDHNVLVIPSRWLETGPLVALEAKAAGLFVIGSRLGGIAELITENSADGLLVASESVGEWAAAIKYVTSLQSQQPFPPRPHSIRTMKEVASDMSKIYERL